MCIQQCLVCVLLIYAAAVHILPDIIYLFIDSVWPPFIQTNTHSRYATHTRHPHIYHIALFYRTLDFCAMIYSLYPRPPPTKKQTRRLCPARPSIDRLYIQGYRVSWIYPGPKKSYRRLDGCFVFIYVRVCIRYCMSSGLYSPAKRERKRESGKRSKRKRTRPITKRGRKNLSITRQHCRHPFGLNCCYCYCCRTCVCV
jgi:hypothetical protein